MQCIQQVPLRDIKPNTVVSKMMFITVTYAQNHGLQLSIRSPEAHVCDLNMYRRFTASCRVSQRSVYQHVLMTSIAGCSPTVFSSIPISRSCSGVPLLVSSINLHGLRSGWKLMPSSRQHRCVTSVSSLTPTSACDLMSSGLSPIALSCCGNFRVFSDQFHHLFIRHCLSS